MILRYRTKPLPLQKLDAAIPRLSRQFSTLPQMKADARAAQQGYTGELKVDYYLDQIAHTYTILHDVYLHLNGQNFQIDSLIIAQHAIFLIDVKHYQGTLTFNTTLRQLTRHDGRVETGFEYPPSQVSNQAFQLQNWLSRRSWQNIPTKAFVAIADPSTIVQVEGDQSEIAKQVMHAADIVQRIMDVDRRIGKNGAKKLRRDDIGRTILRECGNFDINMSAQYGVQPVDIQPGVICPDCGRREMNRSYNGWTCPRCQCFSKHAHQRALEDYFLLVSETITNAKCTYFLGGPNRATTTRLLKKSGLTYNPKKRCWHKTS